MTMENAVLQTTEPASPVEPVSVKPVTPSPEESLNQKISEAVSKAIAIETEKSKRELQSVKDKGVAEVQAAQRRAKFAENTMERTRTHLQSLDPETAKEMELAELRAKEQSRLTLEQEDTLSRQQVEFHQQFQSNLTQFITGLGVDPVDKRIDWAGDAPNYLEAQRRVLDSVAKIQKENIKASEASIDLKIKEAEKRIKKSLGAEEDVNSVSTQGSSGVSSEGIPIDMGAFRKWVAELPQAEYEKKAAKINEMLNSGKIK